MAMLAPSTPQLADEQQDRGRMKGLPSPLGPEAFWPRRTGGLALVAGAPPLAQRLPQGLQRLPHAGWAAGLGREGSCGVSGVSPASGSQSWCRP